MLGFVDSPWFAVSCIAAIGALAWTYVRAVKDRNAHSDGAL